MKLGLFGSAFNPPHNAHLELSAAAEFHFKLDRIIFMPTLTAPHKEITGGWNDSVRLLLAHLAVSDLKPEALEAYCHENDIVPGGWFNVYCHDYTRRHRPEWIVSGWEMAREKGIKSYTVDTVRALQVQYPGAQVHILIGADQAVMLDTWKEWQWLAQNAVFCAAVRPGLDLDAVKVRFPFIKIIPFEPIDSSSTHLRNLLMAGVIPGGVMPAAVEAFVRENPPQGLGSQTGTGGE